MGFLDFFKGKSGLEKHSERVANRRTHNADRWESIQALGKLATTEPSGGKPDERAEAVAGLLRRFTFYVDPTITDGEEKDEAFRWILGAGELAVDPIKAALRSQESLSWGLRCLEQLLSEERFIEEMLAVLGTMDTEYERDPQRKLQLLSTLEERQHPAIAKAVAPFFQDVNETARFHALGAALRQSNAPAILEEVVAALAEEDSVRVKARVFEMLAESATPLPEGAELAAPPGFSVSGGVVRKSDK